MVAPPPKDEALRLRTLSLYNILDTAAEQAFDDLTRLAATICETPIALVSIVDESRQWFKAKVGLEPRETPRDHAFCAHAILSGAPLIVPDAQEDPRFSDNPLVVDDPGIRFYAGVPLEVISGQRLGTLCVIDRTPRQLSDSQIEALRILRNSVVSQLELRRSLKDLSDVQRLLRMCAWCRKVWSDDKWVSLEEYVASSEPVTHGMCAGCEDSNRL